MTGAHLLGAGEGNVAESTLPVRKHQNHRRIVPPQHFGKLSACLTFSPGEKGLTMSSDTYELVS